MYDDVYIKLKKKNKILFNHDSICLKPLLSLMEQQMHRTLVLWAFDCINTPLEQLEKKYPHEKRPRIANQLCQQWASGDIKMPVAKRAILDCHAVCKEIEDISDIALFHAIGQGLSTVHVKTHAPGLPFYELSAIVFEHPDSFEELIEKKIEYYIDVLLYYEKEMKQIDRRWAPFLIKDK